MNPILKYNNFLKIWSQPEDWATVLIWKKATDWIRFMKRLNQSWKLKNIIFVFIWLFLNYAVHILIIENHFERHLCVLCQVTDLWSVNHCFVKSYYYCCQSQLLMYYLYLAKPIGFDCWTSCFILWMTVDMTQLNAQWNSVFAKYFVTSSII